MEDDDETWLTSALPSTASSLPLVSKGTQSDLNSWLSSTTSSIDFSTRSALSRKLKGYSDKKARRRVLRTASTVSLESVTEESSRKNTEEDKSVVLDDETLLHTPIPISASSPYGTTVDRRSTVETPVLLDLEAEMDSPFGEDEDEYCKLEMAALGLSLQSEGGGELAGEEERREERRDSTQDEDEEFFDAPSEFEDDEDAASNGRSRELESLDEEPQRSARQQTLSSRLGVTPRSSSVSPRLATIQPSPPKVSGIRVERVTTDMTSTPVSTLHRKSAIHNDKMSVSLHMPSGHLPPRRIPIWKTEWKEFRRRREGS
ncbi:hypothetical protein PFISCL1PPCAC_28993 [Pristionchus fissidentatus]|uniref:Uncharacterized protein n=1 Tax=Pristionchus fissidentatus TaxID=1538716 RepID=A0AAV5WZ41_9BILA|nr:hypothetical protein PFISCL1PPCAC_28993 [Pristionchus fissidentatus]